MTLVLDNYDSFTYNLVQLLGELGGAPEVFRNDALTVEEIRRKAPARLVVSPGPKTPAHAGVSLEAIRSLAGELPILGVCLGHQAVAVAFGGRVRRARRLMHGKTSPVRHDGKDLFAGVDDPFPAVRYHSLVAGEPLPEALEVTARAGDDDEVMGLRHRELPVWGLQFHPESILTGAGRRLLRNFLSLSGLDPTGNPPPPGRRPVPDPPT